MPIVVNATQEHITIKVGGHYFSFKPGGQKVINNPDVARFIQTDLTDSGLAVLPDLISESEEEVSVDELKAREEQQESLRQELCDQALDRYIDKHRKIIENNQISLKRDLEQANIKADPASYVSKGELEAMRLVAKYQRRAEDMHQAKVNEVNDLLNKIKKDK